jgi:hypothetical protein
MADRSCELKSLSHILTLSSLFPLCIQVAFAIPVGGRTQRAAQLGVMLGNLVSHGVPPKNIFVMEDVEGRPGKVNSPQVAEMATRFRVRVISSHVSRADMPEDGSNFGIHLARHYKFMLDYLLVSPRAAKAVGEDLDILGMPDGTPFEFAVLVEDDLVLAPDFVKYFYAMSKVMKVDTSLYCVSAHQDNAFYGTSYEPPATTPALSALGFDFRRGNHFMAPGWMTSKEIYTKVVRDRWLDEEGQYAYKNELHLRNGHWDRFFDSLTGSRDCIFPEIPRIIHQGADGFTVDQRAQMELYSNLRLSALPVETDYGDLHRLTKDGYIQSQLQFISSATRLSSLEESRVFRHANLVFLVSAKDDKDEAWNTVLNGFFGLIGVGGYGGWEGYVKVRGIFHGAVYVRWLTNLIMLVGKYSPYAHEVDAMGSRAIAPPTAASPSSIPASSVPPASFVSFSLTNGGCFHDKGAPERDLPFHVSYYKAETITPRACLASCIHLGYRYAGIQAGMECWCGQSYGKHGAVEAGSKGCYATCTASSRSASGAEDPVTCGGDWKNSVYWASDATLHETSLAEPADAVYLKGGQGQSCQDTCAAASTPNRPLACSEMLFPLLHRTCTILQQLLGCTSCVEEEDMTRGVYSPGGVEGKQCVLSKGRYIRCSAKPEHDPNYRRACVCQIQPTDAT